MKNKNPSTAIKVIALLLCLSFLPIFTSCGLVGKAFEEGPTMRTEYFTYCYVTGPGASRPAKAEKGNFVCILELTLLGKKQERLIIPVEIDGRPVIQIGMQGFYWRTTLGRGDYKKMFLFNAVSFINSPDGVKVFKLYGVDAIGGTARNHYMTEEMYNELNDSGKMNYGNIANLTYVSNDDVVFIDDYEDGEFITPPPVPTEEGATFAGWFTEPECVNAWDFENDTFHLDEDVVTMKLYAKWE